MSQGPYLTAVQRSSMTSPPPPPTFAGNIEEVLNFPEPIARAAERLFTFRSPDTLHVPSKKSQVVRICELKPAQGHHELLDSSLVNCPDSVDSDHPLPPGGRFISEMSYPGRIDLGNVDAETLKTMWKWNLVTSGVLEEKGLRWENNTWV